ncbi:MAG: MoaD/ThiS family protein [Myxococcaceae bacterium]
MNVTVMVPPTLRGAVDGRGRLDLGVPPNADVADLLESLFKLYPKLAHHMASDRRTGRATTLNVFVSEQMLRDFDRRKYGLREGQKLYLSAGPAKPREVA